ncbi:MAG: hypothetical protein ABIS36_26340 [Chryseolinea sp.]
MTIKKSLFIFLILFVSIGAQAQWDEGALYITKSLSKESIKSVYARTSGGEIAVTGGQESEARIEVYVRPNNNRESLTKAEMKTRIEDVYDLEVTASGGKITAIAKPKTFNLSSRKTLNIAFKIYVPKNTSTDLSTSGGSIHLTGLSGQQNFSTSGGGLDLDQLSGKINGKTSGGGISISNCNDDINVSTSGGSIDAENCSGMIRLSTSGGTINLTKLKGTIDAATSGGTVRASEISGEIKAHTSGGSIKLREMAGNVDVSTSGGNIDMEIDELGKYITASNSGGNIELKLPKNKGADLRLRADNIRLENIENFSGDKEEHKVNGKINGGGAMVDVSTSGTITLGVH